MGRFGLGGALTAGLLVTLVSGVAAQDEWAPERYRALIDASNERVDEFETLGADDSRRSSLVLEAVRLRQQAAAMLRNALQTGAVEEFVEQARSDYFVLEQYVTAGLVDLSRCDEAEAQLDNALSDPLILPVGGLADLESLRPAVSACRAESTEPAVAEPSEPAVADPTEAVAEAREPAEGGELIEPAPAEASRPVLPWVLIGTGGALAIGALAYDISLASDRDELDNLSERCPEDCTADDIARGEELSDDLGTAKWIVGGLLGAAVVAGTVGVVLLLTADESPPSTEVSIAPDGPGELGATVRVRF